MSSAPLTLLHASDLHFGPRHLGEPATALAALARSVRPDAIVVSGDFTQRAKPAQFRAARGFLSGLEAPVAWVPGNHDVPLYRFWERLFDPFGAWRRHFAPELVRDLVVGDRLAVFGVNTAHAWTTKHGRLSRRDLESLDRRLEAAAPGAVRVLVAHHPVAAGPELGSEPVARRGAALLELARRHGVELVLCGHLHHGFSLAGAAGAERAPAGPLVVHCGTTTSSRGRGPERDAPSLQRIEVDAAEIAVERWLWRSSARAFEAAERRRFPRGRPAAGAAPSAPGTSSG